MKIVTKYLLKDFVKIFLLSITAFIALLLVIRAQEIAKFLSIQGSFKDSLLFIGCQIPYILPLAIPISALIASFIQIQKLSLSYEITALRAFGFPIFSLNGPLLTVALLLCVINFFIVSELSPRSKLVSSNKLIQKITSNPLLLLKKSKLLKIKDIYVQFEHQISDEHAENAILAYLNPRNDRMNLLLAENLSYTDHMLLAKNISYVSPLSEEPSQGFDDLYLENHQEAILEADHLGYLLKKQDVSIPYEMLPSKMCLIKRKLELGKKSQKEVVFELSRRCFYIFLPFSLTLIGITFGIKIGRERSYNLKVIKLLLVTLLVFIGFFVGKSFHKSPFISLFFYSLSHMLSWAICLISQRKIMKGLES